MNDDGLGWASASDLLRRLRDHELSSHELMSSVLSRVDALNPAVGAFVHVAHDRALDAAHKADQTSGLAAVLAGLPLAVKDLTLTKGLPTRFGSLVMKDNIPSFDSDVVVALRSAGAIVMGKTAVSEFGVSLTCETKIAPPARNPWHLSESAGGSSGGSAAAVASGMVPWAQGSDGGGSNRVPAALCGVFGFKPTRGAVSHGPLHSGMFGLPINGPIARTVSDIELMLECMSVEYPGEPYFRMQHQYEPSFLRAFTEGDRLLRADGTPLRVLRHCTPMFAESHVHPDVLASWDRCAQALASLGCEVTDILPPFDPSIGPAYRSVLGVLCANPVPPALEPLLMPLTQHVRRKASRLGAGQLLSILGELQNACRRAMRSLGDYDVILCPTIADVRLPLGVEAFASDPEAQLAFEAAFSPFCAAYSLTGQPALAAPMWTAAARPMSVMLAGRPGADAVLLKVAARLEAEGVFSVRHPVMTGPGSGASVPEI